MWSLIKEKNSIDLKLKLDNFKIIKLFPLIIFLQISLCSYSQNAFNLSLAGQWGYGICMTVAMEGNYVFFNSGMTLIILDVSDPTQPIEISAIKLPGEITGIAHQGNHLFVSAGDSGLQIVNLDDIDEPYIEGNNNAIGYATDIAISENFAYIATFNTGLRIFDVSNPASPIQTGYYNTFGNDMKIVLKDDFAYLGTASNGLRIIDISNPLIPFEAGYYNCDVQSMSLEDNYLYLALDQYIVVLNLVNPIQLTQAASYFNPTFWGNSGIVAKNKIAYVTTGGVGLHIVNFQNFTYPFHAGSFDTGGRPTSVVIDGNFAYVTFREEGLRILYVAYPQGISEAGFFKTPGMIISIAVDGNYAYLADSFWGLRIIDISNPEVPNEVGSWYCSSKCRNIKVSGNYAYLTTINRLYILNITDPQTPYLEGYFYYNAPYNQSLRKFTISGEYAYVLTANSELLIINISDPTAPYQAGLYNPGNSPLLEEVNLSGNYAFIAAWTNGLYIIDISVPSAPFLVGHYHPSQSSFVDVAVSGNKAYLAEPNDGLFILDVSNPSAPYQITFLYPEENIKNIEISGFLAFVTLSNYDFRVVNISNPYFPFEETYYPNTNYVAGFDVSCTHAFLTNLHAGILILQLEIQEELVLSPENVSLSYQNGSFQSFVYTQSEWTVEESCDWLDCNPNTGSGCGVINVTYDETTLYEPRFCTIHVHGDSSSAECVITQEGLPAYLSINPFSQNVGPESGYFIIEVSSNINWTTSENCSWITTLPESGSDTGFFAVIYDANLLPEIRTCILTIAGGGLIKYCPIWQDGIVSINNITTETACTLYPDPFQEYIKIVLTIQETTSIVFSFFNQIGTRVEELTLPTDGSRNQEFIIETSKMSPGIYFYQINVDSSSGKFSFAGKLLKK